eukprot:s290_g30.t1
MSLLINAPEKKLQSIDAKLAQALKKVIDRVGEKAAGVRSEMRMKMMERGKHGDFVKGRELFAMILANFKSPDNTEDIHKYKILGEDGPDKTYDKLLEMIAGYIRRGKQDKLLVERERAIKLSQQNARTTPALSDDTTRPAAAKTKPRKEAHAAASSSTERPNPKPKAKPKAKSDAASVLPTPSPKSHSDKKKKPGGGGRTSRSSSPVDKKKIFCNFHFNKGGCNQGDKCQYSHSKKVYDAKMAEKKKKRST